MSIVEPLPASGYGKADWVDYSNYWREADAEWLQSRLVLRYADAASRTADLGATPAFGTLTYNGSALGASADRLEMFSKQHNKWVAQLMLDNITSTRDDNTGVAISHKGASGKGIVLQPANTLLDNPIVVMNGVLSVDGTGATVKTGTKAVKLTTDDVGLVSDSPISATGLTVIGGALTVPSATVSGTLTANNIAMSGTLTGGILNGSRGLVGGVSVGWDTGLTVPAAAQGVFAPAGFYTQQGAFIGSASAAVMQQRIPTTGVLGTAFFSVAAADMSFGPTTSVGSVYMYPQLRVMQGKAIAFHNAAGTRTGWISPSFYAAADADPGAANFPDGTIWVS